MIDFFELLLKNGSFQHSPFGCEYHLQKADCDFSLSLTIGDFASVTLSSVATNRYPIQFPVDQITGWVDHLDVTTGL